ncbi:hypothetical protein FB45DRAFT_5300 [Roridomyces roridus]|uniref:Zn(2)-C6 fungal-type domain-containing protein n=1 Tax=Roridomyces roridus TaxID=1738132 RepID=A0AAD7CKG9_9AGAR|nr:hypothetical protein FB45DRAFT_5300 [Roridomyces roridus]
MSSKPAKFKTPTCALCRQRKLRCDGGDPCGPCSRTRTPVTCNYVPKTVGQLRSELPKGGACISCRQRKRRCDGNFPCRTCKDAARADECQYRDKTGGSGKSSGGPRRNSSPDTASTSSSAASSFPRLFTPENSGAIRMPALTKEEELDGCFQQQPISSFDLFLPWSDSCPIDSGLYSSRNLSSSLDYATSLRPDSADVELSTPCNAFLKHRWQYGLSVTPAKQEALSLGDLSGRVVDPTLVYVCELLSRLVQFPDWDLSGFNSRPSPTESELRLFIQDKLEGPSSCLLDPLVRLQVYTLLAMHAAQKEDARVFQDMMHKASDLVVLCGSTLGLEDAPALEWCPMFDESYLSPRGVAEEARAVFALLVCLDVTASLNLRVPSMIDPALIEVFRRLAAIHRSDTEINFVRAKSALFLRDSLELVAEWRGRWPQGDLGAPGWSKRYHTLIDSIHAHVNFITTSLMEVSCIPPLSGAQPTLKACVVLCLAATAELHGLFAGEQSDARRRCIEAVGEITKIERGFSERDWRYLDSTLSICWSVASRRLQENAVVY